MIAKLTGQVDHKDNGHIILDVHGVGYALSCSQQTIQNLPAVGSPSTLYVEPLFRADMLTLFGFITVEERALFRLLLTVQGVGGRVCMALLSALSPDQLRAAITSEDHKPLTQADGVGPKVAQRIVRELKDKVVGGVSGPLPTQLNSSQLEIEALSALTNLGYKKTEVVSVLQTLLKGDDDLTLPQLIPLALKELTTK